MSDQLWYYVQDDQPIGPVAEAQMYELFAAGTLGPDTTVWCADLSEWIAAEKVARFRSKFLSRPSSSPHQNSAPAAEPKREIRLKIQPSALPDPPPFPTPDLSPIAAPVEPAPTPASEYKPQRIALKTGSPPAADSEQPSPAAPTSAPRPWSHPQRRKRSVPFAAKAAKVIQNLLIAAIVVGGIYVWLKLQQPAEWKEFSSAEGGFSVLLPGAPSTSKKTENAGALTVDYYEFTAKSRSSEYGVAYADFPAALAGKAKPDDVLNGARDGAVANVQGTLLKEEKITLNGHPGRDITAEATRGLTDYTLRARIYLVKNRLYVVIAAVPKKKENSPDLPRFFDSFQLQSP